MCPASVLQAEERWVSRAARKLPIMAEQEGTPFPFPFVAGSRGLRGPARLGRSGRRSSKASASLPVLVGAQAIAGTANGCPIKVDSPAKPIEMIVP
jgi:hypothetical protein